MGWYDVEFGGVGSCCGVGVGGRELIDLCELVCCGVVSAVEYGVEVGGGEVEVEVLGLRSLLCGEGGEVVVNVAFVGELEGVAFS